MNPWVRRGLMAAGAMYVVALVPSSIRPQWTAAPFRKPNQTISVPASAGNLKSRLEHACRAPVLLRPLLGSAQRVRVLRTTDQGDIVSIRDVNCEPYVS